MILNIKIEVEAEIHSSAEYVKFDEKLVAEGAALAAYHALGRGAALDNIIAGGRIYYVSSTVTEVKQSA